MTIATIYRADVHITDIETFISFAKRNDIKTIFKNTGFYDDISFFYIVNGKIVSSKRYPETITINKTKITVTL